MRGGEREATGGNQSSRRRRSEREEALRKAAVSGCCGPENERNQRVVVKQGCKARLTPSCLNRGLITVRPCFSPVLNEPTAIHKQRARSTLSETSPSKTLAFSLADARGRAARPPEEEGKMATPQQPQEVGRVSLTPRATDAPACPLHAPPGTGGRPH